MDIDLETCILAFLIGFALHLLVNKVFIVEEGVYNPKTGGGINPKCPTYDPNACGEGKEYRCFNTQERAIACDRDFDWCNKNKFRWCGEDYGPTYVSEYLFDGSDFDNTSNSVFTSYLKDIYKNNREKIWTENLSPSNIHYPPPISVQSISITINSDSGTKTLKLDRLLMWFDGRLILTSSDILNKYRTEQLYDIDGIPPDVKLNSVEFHTTDSDCVGGRFFITIDGINSNCPIKNTEIRDYTIYGVDNSQDNSQDETYSLRVDFGYKEPNINHTIGGREPSTYFWENPSNPAISYGNGIKGISIEYKY